jgi:hypothetical protein
MNRWTKCSLFLTLPLAACGDDSTAGSAGTLGDDSSGTTSSGVTIDPATLSVTDTDTPADSTGGSTGADATGTTGEPGTTGDTGTTDTGATADTGATDSGTTGDSSSSGDPGGVCGDSLIDMGEDCDSDELGGATCDSIGMGFVGGTLSCAGDCTFDVSACDSCGNGALDAGEDCDGANLGGNGSLDLGLGFTGGSLACDGVCAFDTSACSSVPLPAPGEVIITEIMQNPSVLADGDGEFFELYNPTMISYQLGGCEIEGNADTGFSVDVDLEIGPFSYRVFATDSMVDQGFVADYQWLDADYNLTNATDIVRLVCDATIVDEVGYDDGATFPDPNGQSMSLDPGSYDAVANDAGANWCEATTSYNGDFGTPGADNPVCGGPAGYPIDFCRLQFPTLVDETEGTDVDAFARLFIAGLTDLSGVNDPAPSVIGYVGYGPDGTDPAVDPGWTWTAGVPNPGYGPASPGYEANNDEYQALLTVPSPPGSYDFAFRFSGDSGATFTYCDGQPAGSSDGYSPADAGQMTSQAAPPPPPMFFSEYAEGSSNNKALEIYNPGVGDADLTACEVNIYANGGIVAANTIDLAGALAEGDVFVICENNIDPLVFDPMGCDLLDPGSFYNGDDAVELVCGGVVLDVIGQIGFDPGAEWQVGGVGTQNETIRRDCAVTAGDTNGADVFDPSVEWATFPQDDFSDFGQYVCP